MPGVNVDISTRPSPVAGTTPASGTYNPIGLCERGSTTGYETVTSLSEFEEKCGAATSYGFLYGDLRRFFLRGGSRARVIRVVGPAATVSSVTLSDRATTPVPTLRVDAANAGAWGVTHLTVQVIAGTGAGTYRLQVFYDGTNVEDKDNLVTPADAVAALALSTYVRAASLASATAAPNNQPALLGSPVALAGGSDDRGSITTPMMTAALSRLPAAPDTSAVAIPGYPADLVGPALKAHARATGRVVGMAPAKGTTIAQAAALAGTLTGADGDGSILLWPWVEADGVGSALVSPEGVWAGLRAAAHASEGPWAVPAGAAGQASFITGLEVEVTKAEAQTLNDARVSVFRKIRQNGVNTFRLYGYRSLSNDPLFRLLKTRDLINYIAQSLAESAEDDLFHGIDSQGRRQSEAESRAIALLEPMFAAGALFEQLDPRTGRVVGPAYRADAGPTVNTPAVLARDEFDLYVGIRDSPVSETIGIRISKAGLTAAV